MRILLMVFSLMVAAPIADLPVAPFGYALDRSPSWALEDDRLND